MEDFMINYFNLQDCSDNLLKYQSIISNVLFCFIIILPILFAIEFLIKIPTVFFICSIIVLLIFIFEVYLQVLQNRIFNCLHTINVLKILAFDAGQVDSNFLNYYHVTKGNKIIFKIFQQDVFAIIKNKELIKKINNQQDVKLTMKVNFSGKMFIE
jgi:hypothetical protein